MGQDEKQLTTQTSENITEHKTEACDSTEAKQEHGDPSDAGSTSSEGDDNNPSGPIGTKGTLPMESDGSFSNSAGTNNATPKKGDSDSKEWVIWEFVAVLALLIMVIAGISEILFLSKKVYFNAVMLPAVGVLLLVCLLYKCLRIATVSSDNCLKEGPRSFIKKRIKRHIKKVVRAIGVLILVCVGLSSFLSFVYGIDAGPLVCLLILIGLLFAVFAIRALFYWEVQGVKDAREHAMSMMTAASLSGLILTVTALLLD